MTPDATTKEKYMQRRTFLLTSLLPALLASVAEATEIDPKQTGQFCYSTPE